MKILFLGLGSIGQRHAKNIRKLYGNSVELICYRQRQDNHTIINNSVTTPIPPTKTYNISAFSSLEEAFNQKPDVVFITNPSSMHLDSIFSALKYGCHIFVEKPLGTELSRIQNLLDLVKNNTSIGFVGYQLRFHPAYLQLKSMLKKQSLGTLMNVNFCFGEYLPNAHPYESYQRCYTAKSQQGGGVVFSYCHEIDLMYSLLGLPSTVLAYGGNHSDLDLTVTDHVSLMAYYEQLKLPVQIQLDFVSNPKRHSCTIVGSKGVFNWDMVNQTVSIQMTNPQDNQTFDYSDIDRNHLFECEIKHFFDCISHSKKPKSTFIDGANNILILDAINKSIAQQQIIAINTDFK